MKQESPDQQLRHEYYKVENKSLNKKIISQQRINLLRSINIIYNTYFKLYI